MGVGSPIYIPPLPPPPLTLTPFSHMSRKSKRNSVQPLKDFDPPPFFWGRGPGGVKDSFLGYIYIFIRVEFHLVVWGLGVGDDFLQSSFLSFQPRGGGGDNVTGGFCGGLGGEGKGKGRGIMEFFLGGGGFFLRGGG